MRITRLTVLLLSLAALCCGQQRLTIELPQQLGVKRSAEFTQNLKVSIQPGFHVNSDKPKDEFLIPLQLTWSPGPVTVESVSYPKPENIRVGADNLSVFTGTFQIQTKFRAGPQPSALPITLVGKLRYQACNNQMCFRPASVEVKLPVLVE